MSNTNAIGDRGESIFCTRITESYVFDVYFLGEKAPYVDFLLEVKDSGRSFFAMVQVKSTELGYLKNGNLKASLTDSDRDELINRPLPTYLAGVDIKKECVYINPVFSPQISYQSSIPSQNVLKYTKKGKTSLTTINKLKADIINYWDLIKIGSHKSSYTSTI